jgi:glycosyltransferase involved in cell wall biosynthesis
MKVLNCIRTMDPDFGGPVESVRQLGLVMRSRGQQVEVVCLDDPKAPWLTHSELPITALGPAPGVYGYSPSFHTWMRNNAPKYDVVIVNGIWQYHSFGAWRALRNLAVPYVLFTHGALDPWFKKTYPLKHLKKWLYWPWAEYRVLRDATAVMFTCEEERVLARQSFWLYRAREMVVNCGTSLPIGDPDEQKRTFFSRYPELEGKRIASFMGRIHVKKGCDLLIKAFARALSSDPEWRLVIAGPDQTGWKAQLQTLAERMGVAGRITWTGLIRDDMKSGLLEASEVFVLPSHQENFGIVVAEALAHGLPVLISNKVNIWREVLGDGAAFVADDTLEGTAHMLLRWSGLGPEERQSMSHQARQCFLRRFEINRAVEALEEVLFFAIKARAKAASI